RSLTWTEQARRIAPARRPGRISRPFPVSTIGVGPGTLSRAERFAIMPAEPEPSDRQAHSAHLHTPVAYARWRNRVEVIRPPVPFVTHRSAANPIDLLIFAAL